MDAGVNYKSKNQNNYPYVNLFKMILVSWDVGIPGKIHPMKMKIPHPNIHQTPWLHSIFYIQSM